VDLREEAVAALAHELRTPLTALRMALQLGTPLPEGGVGLDAELARLLAQAVDNLETLVDSVQEQSRLERGRVSLKLGPVDVAVAVDEALRRAGERLHFERRGAVTGTLMADEERLVHALAALAQATNRMGTGRGEVDVRLETEAGIPVVRFRSGTLADDRLQVGSQAGLAFFHAEATLRAMGIPVVWRLDEHAAEIEVRLAP